ncbi:hypothetical protein ACIP88_25620 [Streptomyces uncialis]|uniref:hypothetical protein n=1 Tax=Streptomyces uncialis TaxID=1048205 RepID=UPI003826F908
MAQRRPSSLGSQRVWRCPEHGRAQSNVRKNICLIWCGPPPPTLGERVRRVAWRVEEFWRRHVTKRDLHRLRLDEDLERLRRNITTRAERLPHEPPTE